MFKLMVKIIYLYLKNPLIGSIKDYFRENTKHIELKTQNVHIYNIYMCMHTHTHTHTQNSICVHLHIHVIYMYIYLSTIRVRETPKFDPYINPSQSNMNKNLKI